MQLPQQNNNISTDCGDGGVARRNVANSLCKVYVCVHVFNHAVASPPNTEEVFSGWHWHHATWPLLTHLRVSSYTSSSIAFVHKSLLLLIYVSQRMHPRRAKKNSFIEDLMCDLERRIFHILRSVSLPRALSKWHHLGNFRTQHAYQHIIGVRWQVQKITETRFREAGKTTHSSKRCFFDNIHSKDYICAHNFLIFERLMEQHNGRSINHSRMLGGRMEYV